MRSLHGSFRLSTMFAAFVLINALAAPRADAALIVSNLGEPVRDATPIANPQYWGAQSFSPDVDYLLTSVAAIMGNASGSPDAVIELRASNAGEVDTSASGLLATFTVPDLSGSLAVRTFTPNSSVTLLGGVQYWFVVGTETGGFDFAYSATNFATGPGALLPFADSIDAGATWVNRDLEFPYLIEVQGEVVPEPGTLVLVGLGLTGVAAGGRKRRG
jgi:hypothetical protein